MKNTVTKQKMQSHTQPNTIGNLLLSALDMEDEIAHSIYRDYLNHDNWPEGVKPELFEEISKHLNVLLKETFDQRHFPACFLFRLKTSSLRSMRTSRSRWIRYSTAIWAEASG